MYFVTIDNHQNAEKLANILLEMKLIACSNIVGNNLTPINSLYFWEG